MRAGPSPGLETVILNSTGCPLSTLPEVATCSTLSFGSRTIVRALLPARIVTVAAWSKAPIFLGLTAQRDDLLGAGRHDVQVPEQERLGALLDRLARQELQPLGQLVADDDAAGVGRAGVLDDDLERGRLVDVERRRPDDLDAQRDGLPPRRELVGGQDERVGLAGCPGGRRRAARHLGRRRQRAAIRGRGRRVPFADAPAAER